MSRNGWLLTALVAGLVFIGYNSPVKNQPENQHPVILITDPSRYGDDLSALYMLLESDVKIEAVFAVSGNVWGAEAHEHLTHHLTTNDRSDIPADLGLTGEEQTARYRYFKDVEQPLWGKNFFHGAFRSKPSISGNATPEKLADYIRESKEGITILLLSPATLLSQTLQSNPDLKKNIAHIFILGGAFQVLGNATPTAEFNIWFDPDAANYLLSSGMPITLLPLDALNGLTYQPEWQERLIGKENRKAEYLSGFYKARMINHPSGQIPIWDEALVAGYLNPEAVTKVSSICLGVGTEKNEMYGSLAVCTGGKPITLIKQLDKKKVLDMIEKCFFGDND